jgi:transposase InsO family protein
MEAVKAVKRCVVPQRSGGKHQRVAPDLRLRLVRLCTEEQYPVSVVASESGVREKSLRRWMKRYQAEGEAGLVDRRGGSRCKKLPAVVTQKAVLLKQQNPRQGNRRISDLLKRLFLLPGSPETVRQRLAEQGEASPPPRRKPVRNVVRPRFFERSTPNQMWQTDIFTFRLGGRFAYLIGFIDDYSRFITGLGLYRSQTADNLIELYRRAIGEYNVPKEMLTDNGRQYTNWRGTSRFEAELQKDKVHHIRSTPHHPMTLGKIERFWKSIYEEFLNRAQFDSFENATERIRMWVQYYNYRRPHQGIKGLCPAERFFEVQHELRKTLEQGVADNVLEMALRGKPKAPFYMVGRMGEQSVVLRAEKGKLRLVVDGQGQGEAQESEFELEDQGERDGQEEAVTVECGSEEPQASSAGNAEFDTEEAAAQLHGAAEGGGGAECVDGAAGSFGGVQGAGHRMDYLEPVAGAGDGGDAAGVGVAAEPGQGSGVESAASPDAAEESGWYVPATEAAAAAQGSAGSVPSAAGDGYAVIARSGDERGTEREVGPHAGERDLAGAQRSDNGPSGGPRAGGVAQDLLRVGSAGHAGDAFCPAEPACWAACPYRRGVAAREAATAAAYRGTAAEADLRGADRGGTAGVGGVPAGAA